VKIIAVLRIAVALIVAGCAAVSVGLVQAQTKITAYGYGGDLTSDANSSNGIGNHDNVLAPFQGSGGVSDAALTATAAQEYGVSVGQTFTVTGANGATYTLRYEDTAPQSDSRVDIYDPNELLTGGNDNNFLTSATSFNDGPVVSGSPVASGSVAAAVPPAQSGSTSNMSNQTPFEQVFGSIEAFLSQPVPKAVSFLGTIIAFLCLLWSIANTFYSSYDDEWRPKVMAFIKAVVIVALIANSGTLINGIEQAVNQVYDQNGSAAQIPQVLDNIRANNTAAKQFQTMAAPNWANVGGNFIYALNNFCYSLGCGLTMAIWAVVWVFRFLQDVFIVTLDIILPLAFGLAVTPWFSNIGTSIISCLLGVLLWPVGFLLVDTFVLAVLNVILQALNAWGSSPSGNNTLYGVWFFVAAANPIGFGLALLLIGIVILLVTAFGYYAAVKIITSLFGAAGGMVASGIGALAAMGNAAAKGAALGAGAATLGAGAALGGVATALGGTGEAVGAAERVGGGALSGANEVTGVTGLTGSPRSNVLGEGTGGAHSLTSDGSGEVDGIVDGVSDAVLSQSSSGGGSPGALSSSYPPPLPPPSTGGAVDGTVDGISSAVEGSRNARTRGLGSRRASNLGSSALRGSSADLRQTGLSARDMQTPGALAGFGGNQSFASGSTIGQLGDNLLAANNVSSSNGGNDGGGSADGGYVGSAPPTPPPRRSLRSLAAKMQGTGDLMQRAGWLMMGGAVSRTVRNQIKYEAARALVSEAINARIPPKSLAELDMMRES
jgi:hypothetical protein